MMCFIHLFVHVTHEECIRLSEEGGTVNWVSGLLRWVEQGDIFNQCLLNVKEQNSRGEECVRRGFLTRDMKTINHSAPLGAEEELYTKFCEFYK